MHRSYQKAKMELEDVIWLHCLSSEADAHTSCFPRNFKEELRR